VIKWHNVNNIIKRSVYDENASTISLSYNYFVISVNTTV